jgi:hypothetical protein
MTVQVLDSITLWNGSHGVMLTPLGFGAGVVQDNDRPERVRLVQEDSTALQRGYIAHREIRGRALWLKAVHGRLCLTGGRPVAAEWVSGEVHVGIGTPPENLNDAYFARYAQQIRLVIEEGLVESAWRMERVL